MSVILTQGHCHHPVIVRGSRNGTKSVPRSSERILLRDGVFSLRPALPNAMVLRRSKLDPPSACSCQTGPTGLLSAVHRYKPSVRGSSRLLEKSSRRRSGLGAWTATPSCTDSPLRTVTEKKIGRLQERRSRTIWPKSLLRPAPRQGRCPTAPVRPQHCHECKQGLSKPFICSRSPHRGTTPLDRYRKTEVFVGS